MIKLEIKRSEISILWSLFWSSLALFAVSFFSIATTVQVLLFIVVIGYAYLNSLPTKRRFLSIEASLRGQNLFWSVNGESAELIGQKLMAYRFMFLYFQADSGKRKVVVIWPDSLDEESLYRLRLCLLAACLLPKYRAIVAG